MRRGIEKYHEKGTLWEDDELGGRVMRQMKVRCEGEKGG